MKNLGEKINKLREKIGISQKELADRAQIDPSYVSQLEDGRYKSISLKRSKQLADGLGLTLRDFLSDLGVLENKSNIDNSFELLTDALRSNGYTSPEIKQITIYAKFIKRQLRMEKKS